MFSNAAGTGTVVINSNGQMGIGTTNPGSLLTVGDGTNTGATPLGVYNTYNGAGGVVVQNLSTGTGAASTLALGDSGANNRGGISLFGSGYTASAQYRTGGTYLYNNITGGVTVHAEAANSNVYIATAGSERMRILANGNVGIGLTSPACPLNIAGDLSIATRLGQFRIQGATNPTYLLNIGLDTTVGAPYAYIQPEWAGNSYRNLALNPAGGNVGIGTTSPTQTLTVGTGGTVNFSNALYTQFNTITSQYYTLSTLQGGYNTTSYSYSGGVYTWTAAGAGGQFAGSSATLVAGGTYQFSITIKTTTSGSAATFQLESPAFNVLYTSPAVLTTSYVNYTFIVTAPTGASGMIFRYSAGVNGSVININAFSVMRFDTIGTGSVGIGSTSPVTNLDVVKTTAAGTPAIEIRGGGAGPRLQAYGRDSDAQAWIGLGADMTGGPYEHSVYFSNANTGTQGFMTFGSYNGTTYSEKMRITVNGNVGIGTTNPVTPLHVYGGAITTRGVGVYPSLGGFMKPYVYAGFVGGVQIGSVNASGTELPTIYITDSSTVGIGTTNPGYLLDVQGGPSSSGDTGRLCNMYANMGGTPGTGEQTARIYFTDAGITECGVRIGVKSVGLTGNQNFPFQAYYNGTPLVSITGGGTVGIGTTSPGSALAVYTVQSGRHGISIGDTVGYSTTGAVYGLSILNTAGGTVAQIGTGAFGTTTSQFLSYNSTGTAATDFFAITQYGYTTGSGFVQTGANNVGIGITNPSKPLVVKRPGAGGNNPAIMIANNGSGQGLRIATYDLTADPRALMGLGVDMGGSSYEHSLVFPYGTTGVGDGRQTVGYYDGTTYSTRSYILTSSTNWVTISDIREKDVVRPISNVLPNLETLSTIVYTLKKDTIKHNHLGLIAQEVALVFPEACDIPADSNAMMGVNYSELVPVLVEAVKELSARVKFLETKFSA